MEDSVQDTQLERVRRYYDRTESRIGYSYLLGGTKHFGWYDSGDPKWQFKAAMRRTEDQLARRLDLPADALVLDAGCGTGAVARALATRHGLRVSGIDILDWNIVEAVKKSDVEALLERTDFSVGDYHQLEFPDARFDGVYTMETLVHSHDAERVLGEFFRVLKPGGQLALFEYSRNPQDEVPPAAWKVVEQVCDQGAMPSWKRFEHGVLDTLVAGAGFEAVATEDVTARVLPMLAAFASLGKIPYWVGRRIGKVEKMVNAMSGVEMYRHRSTWRYNIITARKPL